MKKYVLEIFCLLTFIFISQFSFSNNFNRNNKEMSFKFKSLGNELDSSTKNSHWDSFSIFLNLIKFFLK